MFSEVCARRADPVRYSAARCSSALLTGALLRCPNITTLPPLPMFGRKIHMPKEMKRNGYMCPNGGLL